MSQSYTANVWEETVLKGNTAIFKCHVPSFVSDYVFVTSWLQDDGHEIISQDGLYGASLVFFTFSFHLSASFPTLLNQKFYFLEQVLL